MLQWLLGSPVKEFIKFIIRVGPPLNLFLIFLKIAFFTLVLLFGFSTALKGGSEFILFLLEDFLLPLHLRVVLSLAISHHFLDLAPHAIDLQHKFVLLVAQLFRLSLELFNV